MRRAHDARVVDAGIDEGLVELDVLLREGVDEIVKLQAGDRQHRGAVELRVIEPVEQMNAARPRGREANAEPSGVFGVAAGHERRGLLMANLDEADLVLPRAQ